MAAVAVHDSLNDVHRVLKHTSDSGVRVYASAVNIFTHFTHSSALVATRFPRCQIYDRIASRPGVTNCSVQTIADHFLLLTTTSYFTADTTAAVSPKADN